MAWKPNDANRFAGFCVAVRDLMEDKFTRPDLDMRFVREVSLDLAEVFELHGFSLNVDAIKEEEEEAEAAASQDGGPALSILVKHETKDDTGKLGEDKQQETTPASAFHDTNGQPSSKSAESVPPQPTTSAASSKGQKRSPKSSPVRSTRRTIFQRLHGKRLKPAKQESKRKITLKTGASTRHLPGRAFRIIRVEKQYKEYRKLDSKDTIARFCCGPKFAGRIFRFGRKCGTLIYSTWLAGCILGFLGFVGAMPAWAMLFYAATLPAVIQSFLLMSRVLVQRLLWAFETWYMILLTLAITLVYVDATSAAGVHGYGAIFSVIISLNFGVMIFNDAHIPGRNASRDTSLLYIFGAMMIMAVVACTQVGLVPNIQSRKVDASIGSINIKMDLVLFANFRLITMCLFFLKNAFLHIRHPEAFSVITARVLSTKTTAERLHAQKERKQRKSQLEKFKTQVRMTFVNKQVTSLKKIASVASMRSSKLRMPPRRVQIATDPDRAKGTFAIPRRSVSTRVTPAEIQEVIRYGGGDLNRGTNLSPRIVKE